MATTWGCADGHTHTLATASRGRDSLSAGGQGTECITCGDRLTGINYTSDGGTPVQEWVASTRTTKAAD